MTTEEFGALLYDLLSEATHVVDVVSVDETPAGAVLPVGLKNGTFHRVSVTSPGDELKQPRPEQRGTCIRKMSASTRTAYCALQARTNDGPA